MAIFFGQRHQVDAALTVVIDWDAKRIRRFRLSNFAQRPRGPKEPIDLPNRGAACSPRRRFSSAAIPACFRHRRPNGSNAVLVIATGHRLRPPILRRPRLRNVKEMLGRNRIGMTRFCSLIPNSSFRLDQRHPRYSHLWPQRFWRLGIEPDSAWPSWHPLRPGFGSVRQ